MTRDSSAHWKIEIQKNPEYTAFIEQLWSGMQDRAIDYLSGVGELEECFPAVAWKIIMPRPVKNTALPTDARIRLRKEVKRCPFFKNEIMHRFVMSRLHEIFYEDAEPEPWETFMLLVVTGLLEDIDHGVLLSSKSLDSLLAEETSRKRFAEETGPLLPLAKALNFLEEAHSYRKVCIKLVKTQLKDFRPQELSTLDDLERLETLEKDLLQTRRTFHRHVNALHARLEKVLDRESMPGLAGCVELKGLPFLRMIDEKAKDIRNELKAAYERLIPQTFDADAVRALLSGIKPALRNEDMTAALEEIAAIESGRKRPDETYLMSAVLPAMLDEKPFDDSAVDDDFPYSFIMVKKIKRGEYLLCGENPTLKSSAPKQKNPQPECVTDDHDEAEQGDAPAAALDSETAASESEPASSEAEVPGTGASASDTPSGQAVDTTEYEAEAEENDGLSDIAEDESAHDGEAFDAEEENAPSRNDSGESAHDGSEHDDAAGPELPTQSTSSSEAPEGISRHEDSGKTPDKAPACTVGASAESETTSEEEYGDDHLEDWQRPRIVSRPEDREPSAPMRTATRFRPVMQFSSLGLLGKKIRERQEKLDASMEKRPSEERPVDNGMNESADESPRPPAALPQAGSSPLRPQHRVPVSFTPVEALPKPSTETAARPQDKNTPRTMRLREAVRGIAAREDWKRQVEDTEVGTGTATQYVHMLLDRGDTCALYWLAEALEERSPLPLWLAELLHAGTNMMPGLTRCRNRIHDLLSSALENMDDLNEEQCLLLEAAMLRPALMIPESSMDSIVSSLAGRLGAFKCTPLLNRLASFIRPGKPMNGSVFFGQSDTQELMRKHAALVARTTACLDTIPQRKINYQPATKLMLMLFDRQGPLGSILHDCLQGDDSHLTETIETFSDRSNLSDLFDRLQKERGRKVKTITAGAFERLCKVVAETVDLMREWESYFQDSASSSGSEPSYFEEQLRGFAGEIHGEPLNSCAEGRFLLRQLRQTFLEENHPLPKPTCDPMQEIELWPLKLPCSHPSGLRMFSAIELMQALDSLGHENPEVQAASLIVHMAEGTLEKTAEFLNVYPAINEQTPDPQVLGTRASELSALLPDTLEEFHAVCRDCWNGYFLMALDEAEQAISDCHFRGAIHNGQQGQSNSDLQAIRERYRDSIDKIPALRELEELEMRLQYWDERQMEEVQTRINDLLSRQELGRDGEIYLKDLAGRVQRNHLYSAAWDGIARLENAASPEELTSLEETRGDSQNAAQNFYEQLEKGDISKVRGASAVWDDSVLLSNRKLARSGSDDKRPNPKDVARITELLRWLGFNLSQNESGESLFEGGRPNYWRVLRYGMTISSEVPHWGSRAQSHVIAFGWNVSAADILQLFNNESVIHDQVAVSVICFNPLSMKERRTLLGLFAGRSNFPLVIDTNLFNYLSGLEASRRRSAMFQVCLAGAPYNPYTPDVAGAVPTEMFFGRKESMASVRSSDGACILYGGRQLGKSALLYQIFRSEQNSNLIRVMLHSMTKTEKLLEVVCRECMEAGIVAEDTERNSLSRRIQTWLEQHPGKRILMLLDECDIALDEDARRNFRDVTVLRDLMQNTGRRFKVVFTGLHSVQRFSMIPNSPLEHFAEPICIGPLSPAEANSLMTKPMKLLGLEFESPELVSMALNYCNYHPKLIQLFCSELVKAVKKRWLTDYSDTDMNVLREPFHTITKDTMLKVYASQELKNRILNCFEITLNLDDRYQAIAYTMALDKMGSFSLRALYDDLRFYWPAAFSRREDGRLWNDQNTLRSLLHEMEGLGLVLSQGGKYRLRTPNLVELMGGEENVQYRLEDFYEKPYDPQGNLSEMRLREADVFVAAQYSLLTDKKSGPLYWISGSDALGLSRVPEALKYVAAQSGLKPYALHGNDVPHVMGEMQEICRKKAKNGLMFLLYSRKFAAMGRFMKKADDWLNGLHRDKPVKVVCLVDPDTLYEFIRSEDAERFSSYQIPLELWTQGGAEAWFKDDTSGTGPDARKAMELTHGWPCLMHSCLVSGGVPDISSFRKPGFCMPDDPDLMNLLANIVDTGSNAEGEVLFRPSELREVVDIPLRFSKQQELEQALQVLLSLHVLREDDNGLLEVDPLVVDALTQESA